MNFQESTIILNVYTKKVWKLIKDTTYLQRLPSLSQEQKYEEPSAYSLAK